MPYKQLKILLPFTETAFRRFYDEMLSNEVFARHFRSQDHIKELIVKLIANFEQSLSEPEPDLEQRYLRVGKTHYQYNIPYEVFISGSRLLRDIFTEISIAQGIDSQIVLQTEKYFCLVIEAMAKGYFNRFIEDNLDEIEKLVTLIKETSTGMERDLLIRHYHWLTNLLIAVRDKDIQVLNDLVTRELDDKNSTLSYIGKHIDDLDSVFKQEDIERVRFRLLTNANSIIFYLEHHIYSEALSLILNLLEVYKLTLMLDSVINNIIVRRAEFIIEEKSRLTEIDPLTKVYNRRKLDAILEGLVLRSNRLAEPMTLCIMDIDDFKLINDKYGHDIGDQVLIKIAHLIQGTIRKHDFVARFGGEEFVVIFAHTDRHDATHVAEAIRKKIGAYEFENVGQVTMSMGLAELRANDNEKTLFKRADQRLYEAKSAGKNQICG